jgi:nucleoside-diphosphate-sugar epimerase
MKVLVTGANGFIGSKLVRSLLDQGHQVRCLFHRSRDQLEGLDVHLVQGSVTDPLGLPAAVEGVEAVFHLAGSGRAGDWGSRKWFFEQNADGTEKLLNAAIQAKVRRFVQVSSLAVHRFTGHLDAGEDTPADQEKYAYGASKLAAERHVRRAGDANLIETVIVRPAVIVFGPGDTTAFIHMAPMLEKGRWTHVKGGKPFLCYTYVSNLADGLLLAGTHPQAAGEIFNITDDMQIRWKEFVSAVVHAFESRERAMSFPVPIARAAGITLEAVFKLLGTKKPPPITDYRTALVSKDFHFSCGKAKRMLGYRPRVSFHEGLRRTVDWYRKWKQTQ